MSSRNIATPLTSITSINKFKSIIEKSGPIKSILQNFLSGSIGIKVTSHFFEMAMFQDGMCFLSGNIPLNNFFTAYLEDVRFFPQVILNIGKEFLSLCIRKVRGKYITCEIVHRICILGYYGGRK